MNNCETYVRAGWSTLDSQSGLDHRMAKDLSSEGSNNKEGLGEEHDDRVKVDDVKDWG